MKKYPIAILLSLAGVFQFTLSLSQENYQRGFVVDLKGDTIRGVIDYRNWKTNPRKIKFKKQVNDVENSLGILDIKSFRVLDEIYVSAIVQVEVSPIRTLDLNSSSEMIFRMDTTFLQTMIAGTKSLYSYLDHSERQQFYIFQNSTFELLLHKRFLATVNGLETALDVNKYFGQLSQYLQDCPGIMERLKKLTYDKRKLENLFQYYYSRCDADGLKFRKATEKIIPEFGFFAGGSLTKIRFAGVAPSDYYNIRTNFQPSAAVTGGVFLELVLPRGQKKWSINNELMLNSYSCKGSYTDFFSSDNYSIGTTSISATYLKLNSMARYRYPVGRAMVFLNAGLSVGAAVDVTTHLTEEKHNFGVVTINESKALDDTSGYEVSLLAGAGVKASTWSIEFRGEVGNGLSPYETLSSPTKRYFVLFGIKPW